MRIVKDDWSKTGESYVVFDAASHYRGSINARLGMFTTQEASYTAAELREIADFIDKQVNESGSPSSPREPAPVRGESSPAQHPKG